MIWVFILLILSTWHTLKIYTPYFYNLSYVIQNFNKQTFYIQIQSRFLNFFILNNSALLSLFFKNFFYLNYSHLNNFKKSSKTLLLFINVFNKNLLNFFFFKNLFFKKTNVTKLLRSVTYYNFKQFSFNLQNEPQSYLIHNNVFIFNLYFLSLKQINFKIKTHFFEFSFFLFFFPNYTTEQVLLLPLLFIKIT